MSGIIKIYLDTSVINFLFADDAPELQEITIDLFENYIKKNKYKTFISDFVLFEIDKTSNKDKKDKLLNVIEKYKLDFINLENEKEITNLANKYINSGTIPRKSEIDAFHIAICVLNKIDYLVSWNYKHLANVNKEQRIKMVNVNENYLNELRIITPMELLNYED